MTRFRIYCLLVATAVAFPASARSADEPAKPAAKPASPSPELLWPKGALGAMGTADRDQPTLTLYKPAKPNGAAIVICPGGGYSHLAMGHEGADVAAWLNREGVTAGVLKYRLSPYRHPAPMQDVQRALRTMRHRAKELGLDAQRIGVLGFSAGGHLASTAATHFDAGNAEATDPIDRESCRPDFAVLVYPVISLTTKYTHQGSKRNLLGDNPPPELVESLSNEKQVTAKTPPTFLMHTWHDAAVPPENSILFYMALREAKVPSELHLFEPGGHGFGLAPTHPVLAAWPERCIAWMKGRGLFSP